MHFQFFGVAVKGDVRPAVAVQIRHGQRGDVFVRPAMESMRKRASGGSSLSSSLRGGLASSTRVGFAGAIVEQVDFGTQIVDDDQVVQAVAVQIRRVQQADAVVNRKNFLAGETKRLVASAPRTAAAKLKTTAASTAQFETWHCFA